MPPLSPILIKQLTQLTELSAIYSVPSLSANLKPLLLLLSREPITGQVLSELKEYVQQQPHYRWRMYEEAYVIYQFKKGNVCFIQALQEAYVTYRAPEATLPSLNVEEAFEKAPDFFYKEHQKALDFQEGADFYIGKENYPQAAFMLHQAIELSFRTVELISMGKEKICHKIVHHQHYIQDVIPELGELFKEENMHEKHLLNRLDTAYRDVRYAIDYNISLSAIENLQHKLDSLLETAEEEFLKRYAHCKNAMEKPSPPALPNEKEIEKNLRQLIRRQYKPLNKHTRRFYQHKTIAVEDPLESFLSVTHLLKVCVLALEHTGTSFSKTIPQPYVNIQQSLEFALQLLPYEEMEFLEQLIEDYGGLSGLLAEQEKIKDSEG